MTDEQPGLGDQVAAWIDAHRWDEVRLDPWQREFLRAAYDHPAPAVLRVQLALAARGYRVAPPRRRCTPSPFRSALFKTR